MAGIEHLPLRSLLKGWRQLIPESGSIGKILNYHSAGPGVPISTSKRTSGILKNKDSSPYAIRWRQETPGAVSGLDKMVTVHRAKILS